MPERTSWLARLKPRKKVPVRLQMNQYECGPSCLHMILAYYGYEADFSKLKERFTSIGHGRDGSSMLKMKEVSETYQLTCMAKKATPEQLDNGFLPIILFWEHKHFVVLEQISKRKMYTIIDPSLGRQVLSKEEFSDKYSGVFLFASPGEEFHPGKEKKYNKLEFFTKIINNNKRYFLLAVSLALVLQLVAVAVPVFMQMSVDAALESGQYSFVTVIIAGMLLLTVLQLSFGYFKEICIVKLQELLDSQITNGFVAHMLRLPYKFFEVRSRGDLMLRLNSNVTIRELMSQKFISTVIHLLLVVVTFSYIFIQSKLVAAGLLMMGTLQICVFLGTRSKFKKLTQTQVVAQSMAGSFMTEALEGMSTIKALSIEDTIGTKWKQLFRLQLKAVKDKSFYQAKINTMNNAFNLLTPLLVLATGIYLVIHNSITIGMLFAFQSLAMSFIGPLNALALMLNDFVMADTLLDRIYDVMHEKADTPDHAKPQRQIAKLEGNIRIEGVSFQYTDYSGYALHHIDVDIEAGQRVALVGKSGSGKSTLANLLVGLYMPTTGAIYFDGWKITELDRKSLRQKIGIVLQDNFVFNRTIYDNITMHAPAATIEDVQWAAHMAEIAVDIEKMPMKYNTLITESGTNLSGGQKQRMALARALVNRPNILLLDEATSALDTVTETRIGDNLRSLNCTQIIIAHRLSTIIASDIIYVLDEGMIVDAGSHEELMSRCHHYRQLVASQLADHRTHQRV